MIKTLIAIFSHWTNYAWRVIGTGFSFAIFGIGGIFIGFSLFVLLHLHLIPIKRRNHYGRRFVAAAFRLYINFMRAIGLLSYEINHLEQLPQGQGALIIANHPSLLDVVYLLSFVNNANCIVKGALLRNPFTRSPITACGFINNDSPNMLNDAVAALQRGESLIIFPEGTRSMPGKPLKFLRGAANIALHSGIDLTPILISCNPPTLLKDQKWWQIPAAPPHFCVDVQSNFPIAPWVNRDEMPSKKARQLTQALQNYYKDALD